MEKGQILLLVCDFSAPRDFIAQNPPSRFLVLFVGPAKDILRRSQPLHAPPSNAPP